MYNVFEAAICDLNRQRQKRFLPEDGADICRVFHDRFLIVDKTTAYHIGASLKDAGKKCFGITKIEDIGIVSDILQRLEIETEEAKNKKPEYPLWHPTFSDNISVWGTAPLTTGKAGKGGIAYERL